MRGKRNFSIILNFELKSHSFTYREEQDVESREASQVAVVVVG